jgi:predicted nucleic acid-binding protein
VILLDTSFLIDFFRSEHLKDKIPEGEIPVTTVITYYEIMAGVRRTKSKREEAFFQKFFSEVEILDLTLPAAGLASEIGARMAAQGNTVNAFDILIAGIALSHHVKGIMTADNDFSEVAKYADITILGYDRPGS